LERLTGQSGNGRVGFQQEGPVIGCQPGHSSRGRLPRLEDCPLGGAQPRSLNASGLQGRAKLLTSCSLAEPLAGVPHSLQDAVSLAVSLEAREDIVVQQLGEENRNCRAGAALAAKDAGSFEEQNGAGLLLVQGSAVACGVRR